MRKAILIVCGGVEATHGIARAKEMGLHDVVAGLEIGKLVHALPINGE